MDIMGKEDDQSRQGDNDDVANANYSRRITKLQDLGSFEASLDAVKVDKSNNINGTSAHPKPQVVGDKQEAHRRAAAQLMSNGTAAVASGA